MSQPRPWKTRSNSSALALLAIALLVGQPASAADNSADEARLEELKVEIAKLQQWLNQASDEHSKLSSSMQKTDKDIDELSRKIEETRRLLQEEQAQVKKLYQEQAQLNELQAAHRARLQAQVQAAYRLGSNSPVKLLLNQDDPEQARRMLTWFGYFNNARIQQIDVAISELQRLEHIREDIAAEEARLHQSEAELLQQTDSLATSKQEQQRQLASLQQQMQSEQQRLRSKEADRKRLESLLQEVQTLVEKSPRKTDARPFASLKGQLPKPVEGKLLASFGSPHSEGPGSWQGWLISAPEGNKIKAVHHGRVVYADWLRGYGLLMILDHGDGFLTLYAHTQTLQYGVGSWVNQGDVIGTVGMSGGQSQAGLYFEIRKRGQPQNPAGWLSRK